MTYVVKSSEKLRKSGAEAETKALLYLMNFHEDRDEMHYFVVDFFNDLTGMDRMGGRLWDLQSKGARKQSPKSIGKGLVTLFKNYTSSFDFKAYILFVGGVSNTLGIDPSANVFRAYNVLPPALDKVKEGILEEGKSKEYINQAMLTTKNIDDFLQKVIFVVDDKMPSEYVEAIIKNHPKIIPDKEVLTAIFNEVRDTQASKKNALVVEGATIQTSDQALNYYRHLTSNEIRLMTLQRILNRDPIEQGIPYPFLKILESVPPEMNKEVLEECKMSLCRALFNKNAAQGFWNLFEDIYTLIMQHPKGDIEAIFTYLNKDYVNQCPDFDALSLKYFIAVVKDGIQ